MIKQEERYRGLYLVLLDVWDAVAEILDTTTLADLRRRSKVPR